MNPRCEGLPGWECGKPVFGREGYCHQHGDRETREARWLNDGKSKADIDAMSDGDDRLSIRRPNELQRELPGLLGEFPQDDACLPQKPDVTRPPHMRKGAKRDERVPIPEDLHGRLWHLLTLEEKLTARQTMTDAEIAVWAKGKARNTMTPSEEAKWAAGMAS